jgi:hypothetical protein
MSGAPAARPGRTTHAVTRAGAGQTHCDTIALPAVRFVLVDAPLDPSDKVVFTEAIPAAGPPADPFAIMPVMATKVSERVMDGDGVRPVPVEKDSLVHYWYFWQTVDTSYVSLAVQRGQSRLELFAGLPAGELCVDEAQAPRSALVRHGGVLVYEIPLWASPDDRVLAGESVDYATLDVQVPR